MCAGGSCAGRRKGSYSSYKFSLRRRTPNNKRDEVKFGKRKTSKIISAVKISKPCVNHYAAPRAKERANSEGYGC